MVDRVDGAAGQPSVTGTGVPRAGASVGSGALVGVGTAAFVDETVFHQLLHWHHFYDRSTPSAGLVSDGLFHAFGWIAMVAGFFLLADLRRTGSLAGRRWWAGVLVGAGGFQLYDGTIQHKLLRLHQIRYHVDIVGYDWTWNVMAVLLLGGGLLLLRGRGDPRTGGTAVGRAGTSASGGACGTADSGVTGGTDGGPDGGARTGRRTAPADRRRPEDG